MSIITPAPFFQRSRRYSLAAMTRDSHDMKCVFRFLPMTSLTLQKASPGSTSCVLPGDGDFLVGFLPMPAASCPVTSRATEVAARV